MLAIFNGKIYRTRGNVNADGFIELRQYRSGRLIGVIFAKPENVVLDDSPSWFDIYSKIPTRGRRKTLNTKELSSLFG